MLQRRIEPINSNDQPGALPGELLGLSRPARLSFGCRGWFWANHGYVHLDVQFKPLDDIFAAPEQPLVAWYSARRGKGGRILAVTILDRPRMHLENGGEVLNREQRLNALDAFLCGKLSHRACSSAVRLIGSMATVIYVDHAQ